MTPQPPQKPPSATQTPEPGVPGVSGRTEAQKRSQRLTHPNGCRHCGTPEYGHVQIWTRDAGWHKFTEPTDEQRLTRMRNRQAARPAEPRPNTSPQNPPTNP